MCMIFRVESVSVETLDIGSTCETTFSGWIRPKEPSERTSNDDESSDESEETGGVR